MVRPYLLLAGLLALSCGESERPPLVPAPAPLTAPWTAPAPALAPVSEPFPAILRVADLLPQPPPPGTYLLDAYALAHGGTCPPCPPHALCSPCPPTEWFLADTADPGAPHVPVLEPPPPLVPGARYRLRIEPVPPATWKGAVRIVAVLSRLAQPAVASVADDGCDACVSRRVEWDFGGILYVLEPCRGFSSFLVGSGRPHGGCGAQLACSPGLSPTQIERALGNADVEAARQRAPIVFGRDRRATNGTLMHPFG